MTGNRSSEGEVAAKTILYGASYYHEYMPYERLERDIELMNRAGPSVVRLGESNMEPMGTRRRRAT